MKKCEAGLMKRNAITAGMAQPIPDDRLIDTSPTSYQPKMRRVGLSTFLKASLTGVMLVVLSVAACIALTDPKPATLPSRASQWLAFRSWQSSSVPPVAPRAVSEETLRPAWDEKFDESGYSAAIRFSKPIENPALLAHVRDSVVGRGRRGIAYLQDKLASLPPGPGSSSTAADIHVLIGSLLMCEGQWTEASEHFALRAEPLIRPDRPYSGRNWAPCGGSQP